jgi:hypothetical protein
MARSRFQITQRDIETFFNKNEKSVYSFTEMGKILSEKGSLWRLPRSMTTRTFLKTLLERTKLKKVDFNFPSLSFHRYTWEDANIYEIASSLIKNSYFSHYSALYLHELTEQIPKVIFLNYEQPAKPKVNSELSQQGINIAFSRPPRITKNFCIVNNYTMHLLNGKKTGNLGVVTRNRFSITDLERTIIDITIRPHYSGGVFEVLNAYKKARDNLSVSRLSALLSKLDYIYPYYQAIGFYLERAGYSSSQIQSLEGNNIKFDFYLANQIKDPEYSNKWRIFYPKGL